jgi:hypothetical protein
MSNESNASLADRIEDARAAGLAACAGCNATLEPADAFTVAWVPGDRAPGTLCLACLVGDSDGVCEAVDEEETSAQTVRAEYEPIGDEGLGDVRANRRAA